MARKYGWTCPHCGNKDRNLMQSNLGPNESPKNHEETMLCEAIIPKGQDDSFDQVSDGTAVCGMQWDPREETHPWDEE